MDLIRYLHDHQTRRMDAMINRSACEFFPTKIPMKPKIRSTIEGKWPHQCHIDRVVLPHQVISHLRTPRSMGFDQMNICFKLPVPHRIVSWGWKILFHICSITAYLVQWVVIYSTASCKFSSRVLPPVRTNNFNFPSCFKYTGLSEGIRIILHMSALSIT